MKKVLEISSTSLMSLGARLSAIKLKKRTKRGITYVEPAFQSSRIYSDETRRVGPFPEYMFLPGKECKKIYKEMGINAIIYNLNERDQYRHVPALLSRYKPEILVLTGHDAFIKRRNDIYNIDNYKNSKYFIQSVLEARKFEHNLDNLVIFAGACQSYYEAIVSAGANFASAPKRVLIDMMDPMIVAQSVAYTPVNEFVSLENIISNTREGIYRI